MQGTYECVKVIGTFHRYGVQQSVDSNGTFYYRPVVYMKDCKDLNNIDLKIPDYLLFNLTDNDSHMRFIFRNHIINHASLHLIPIYIP